MANVTILPIDGQTAKLYGINKNCLKRAGKPIHENDIWIAAVAQRANIPLMTNDKHFQ
ncbi:MAG: PIN domain-containing protein [Bacteroidota bacterium]